MEHNIWHDEMGPLLPMPKTSQSESSLVKQTVVKFQELLDTISEEGRCELYQILKTSNRASPLAAIQEDIKLKKLLDYEQERNPKHLSGLQVIVSEVISDKYRYLLIKALETDVAIDKLREKVLLRGSSGNFNKELHDAATNKQSREEEDE